MIMLACDDTPQIELYLMLRSTLVVTDCFSIEGIVFVVVSFPPSNYSPARTNDANNKRIGVLIVIQDGYETLNFQRTFECSNIIWNHIERKSFSKPFLFTLLFTCYRLCGY